MQKTGIAELPLHNGKAPRWLFNRMLALAEATVELMILEFGKKELLFRISDPYWFQAFGCLLGFDWHSSGLTTTVTAAIKEALRDKKKELRVFVAGGKAKIALQTPKEIINYAESFCFDPEPFIYASRLSAKVDNVAVQDGFNLYHHTIIFTDEGHWCVIQQGMNSNLCVARRYHWLSYNLKSFVEEPHTAVCCDLTTQTLNFTATESSLLREKSVLLSCEKPETILKEIKKVKKLIMPKRHILTMEDIKPENIYKILIKTYERQPSNFESLLEINGVGPKTLRALALTSELLYGTPLSFKDPARYSFAHGGKDKTPYPLDRKLYDRTIDVLKKAIEEAKIGRTEKIFALRRLNQFFKPA
jgi:hypothetical protein